MFDKQWFLKYQKQLLWLLNTPFVSIWFRYVLRISGNRSSVKKRKIVRILPDSITWVEKRTRKKIYFSTEFRTDNKFSKRIFHGFYLLWFAFHTWDMVIANPLFPSLNLGFDTLTVNPDPHPESATFDGWAGRDGVNETFATIIAGAGTNSADAESNNTLPLLRASATTNQWQGNYRPFYLFDTSSIPDTNTISAAVLSIYIQAGGKGASIGTTPIHTVSGSPASNTAVANSDYGNVGNTTFGNIAWASLTENAYNDWNLNATGIATVSKTGISKFSQKLGWDIDGSFTGSWSSGAGTSIAIYFAEDTGTSRDPKLVVTHAVAAATGAPWEIMMSGVGR